MNLIQLVMTKDYLSKVLETGRIVLSLERGACLVILRAAPVVEAHYTELGVPLYVVSLIHKGKTLNKNKRENVSFFISLVGSDTYDFLESLVSMDRDRYFNKGNGIGYLCLTIGDVSSLLGRMLKHKPTIFSGGELASRLLR